MGTVMWEEQEIPWLSCISQGVRLLLCSSQLWASFTEFAVLEGTHKDH